MLRVTYFNDAPEIIQISTAYWEINSQGEFLHSTGEIGKKYGISANKVTQIAKEHSSACSDSLICISCSSPYRYENRTDYYSAIKINTWTCNICLSNEKELLAERNKTILLQEFKKKSEDHPLSIGQLDVRTAVLLLSLIRYGANEDLTFINEYIVNKTDRLSPDADDDMDFLRELFKEGCISIDPSSNPSSIILEENGSLSFYINSIRWLLPLSEGQTFKDFTILLEEKLAAIDYLENNYDEIIELCKDVALRECLAYLKYKMEEHKLQFTPGDKTKLVLTKALEEYSVSQVYGLIWSAVNNTAAFYMRTQGISKKQAANTVVGNIEKNFERAYTQNWDVKDYRRDRYLPQSIISRVLFNVLLHTDDGGFYLPLKKIINLEGLISI